MEEKRTFWGIPNFPVKTKDRFLGECKKRGISMRNLLDNLIKAWLRDVNK